MFFHECFFKAHGRKGFFGGCLPIEKGMWNDEERTVPFSLTDEVQDRAKIDEKGRPAGDVIRIDGIEMRDYLKNPVLMPFHDYAQFPIGIVQPDSIVRRRNSLRGVAQYAPPEAGNPMAVTAWGMTRAGMLRAYSIGFYPIKALELPPEARGCSDDDEDPYKYRPKDFHKIYLLEVSNVPIPMNQNALVGKDAEYMLPALGEAVVRYGGDGARLSPDSLRQVFDLFISWLEHDAKTASSAELTGRGSTQVVVTSTVASVSDCTEPPTHSLADLIGCIDPALCVQTASRPDGADVSCEAQTTTDIDTLVEMARAKIFETLKV